MSGSAKTSSSESQSGSSIVYILTPCGPGIPCEDCTGEQPAASVVITGECESFCADAAGTYVFYDFIAIGCIWEFRKGDWRLNIRYIIDVGVWVSTLEIVHEGSGEGFSNYGDNVLCCEAGQIKGTLELPGFVGACGGCAATVTLAGGGTCSDNPEACPGGAPIFTDTDMSAHVGLTVKIEEDPDACYLVGIYDGVPDIVVSVTVTDTYEDCVECCSV